MGAGSLAVIGGGGSSLSAVIAGVPTQQFVCSAVGGNQRIFYPPFPVMLRTSRSLIGPTVDDCAVYRIVVAMCGGGVVVTAGRDFGFELVRYAGSGVQSRLVADNVPGIGLRIQDGNVVQLLINGPNGIVVRDLTAAPFNINSVWHTFDMRFFSATANADAFWTLRIDNAPVTTLAAVDTSWGAVGTNLPAVPLNGAFAGFVPTLINDSANNNGLFVHQVHLIAAPTELMTL